jgi:predicted GNAT family N-acyltransferase
MVGGSKILSFDMKYSVVLLSHKDISKSVLYDIVTLKMQHWSYHQDEHLNWISDNLSEYDYHLLVYNGFDSLVAYLNFVDITVSYASVSVDFFGIGNVCVDKKVNSSGYGALLMSLAIFYLKQFKRHGILLCKKELSGFYQRLGWISYNGTCEIGDVKYENSVFLTMELDAPKIIVCKNF